MQETWVWSTGWEDPLEEGMATHSSIWPGESPWAEEPGGLQSIASQGVGHKWALKHSAWALLIPTAGGMGMVKGVQVGHQEQLLHQSIYIILNKLHKQQSNSYGNQCSVLGI